MSAHVILIHPNGDVTSFQNQTGEITSIIKALCSGTIQSKTPSIPSVATKTSTGRRRGRQPGGKLLATRELGLRAKELEAQGLTMKQIGDKLNVSYGTIYRSMKMVKRRSTAWVMTPEFVKEVGDLKTKGYTQDEIATMTGRSKSSVIRAVAKANNVVSINALVPATTELKIAHRAK